MIPELLLTIGFIFAGVMDLKYRNVDNIVWVLLLPICIFMFAVGDYDFTSAVVTSTLTIVTIYTYWHFGQIGGADVKAIMLIAIAYPSMNQIIVILVIATAACYVMAQKYKHETPWLPGLALGVIGVNIINMV